MMKHYFNQYYYTAAPDLFNKTRKSGWGIFGSSTPDDSETNEQVEQISKDWVPMRLLEEKAFPIEYVMYVNDRYVVGGTTSCNTLIKGDNRPNIWTHVLVPEEGGEESFISCLEISSFERVQRREEKFILQPVVIEESGDEQKELLKSWASEETDAALLKELLAGMSGASKKILITDEELAEDDFEDYQLLARAMMRHIYQLLPGCMRKKLNFISPMVSKYFHLSSEKPKGARFYFGPEDQYDYMISMQQGKKLLPENFYDHMLLRMMELYHHNNILYEEIGQRFQKNSYAIRENDYIWHFIYEMIDRNIAFGWTGFGKNEYLDAYNQAWNDENKKESFLKLTEVLQKQKKEFCVSSDCFLIFCRMIRIFEDADEEVWMRVANQAVAWILEAENHDSALIREFMHALSKANIREDMIYQIKYLVMQKSAGFREEEDLYKVSFENIHTWELWKQREDDLKAFDMQRYKEKLQLWKTEFWNQVEQEDILLKPSWKDEVRGIADDLGVNWREICEHFSADISKASFDWGEEQIQESRNLAKYLEPSIRKIFEKICDDASERLLQEAEKERIQQEKTDSDRKMHIENLSLDDADLINWIEENYENYKNTDLFVKLEEKNQRNRLLEYMQLIMLSVFWVTLNLCIYEGILKSVRFGVSVSVAIWAAAIVASASLLFVAIKRRKGIPKTVILFLGSFFWTACAAIMQVLFGFLGEGIFLGVLFILMLILYLISSEEDEE
ncbi:MAG: hypothetical protein Q4E73_01620 [Lachnospiraceae bacterium]|nr:hypothetical protein [Lachnospiraceae bacterium]